MENLSAEAVITGKVVAFDRKTSRIGRAYAVAEIEAGTEAPIRVVCFEDDTADALERSLGKIASLRCRLDCRKRPSGYPEISLAVRTAVPLSAGEPEEEEKGFDPFA